MRRKQGVGMEKILVLNGPNLDMLGIREPEVYGSATLADLEQNAVDYGRRQGVQVACRQSNAEGELIELIHAARGRYDGIVYNPGAHTHYSYALRDAIAAIDVPVVEVHLSDISNREPFRQVSVIAPVCVAQVKGLGMEGYLRAMDILCSGERLVPMGDSPSASDTAYGAMAGGDDCDGNGDGDEGERGGLSLKRCEAVRAACAEHDMCGILVRDTSNIRWITALDGVFDEERAHALLVADGGLSLHTDTRYSNAIRTVADRMGVELAVNDERIGHAQFAFDHLTAHGGIEGALGIEDSITYAEYVKMAERFAPERLEPTTDLVLKLRAVKDGDEIARLRAAQAVTDAAFAHIVRFMRPGMTEREVQLELEDFMVRHGAEGLAFSSIVATGENGADPHAIPGATRLEAGQCVVIDFGAKARGYCSDMTRMVFLGEPDDAMRAAWDTLRRANETVEAALKPGMTGAQAHQLAEQVLEEGGFGGKMGHGLGHGVGLDIHELPVLNTRNETPLEVGNVVTVEPGIYLPGKFGMRLEDCGVISDDGYDVFTQTSHELVVI